MSDIKPALTPEEWADVLLALGDTEYDEPDWIDPGGTQLGFNPHGEGLLLSGHCQQSWYPLSAQHPLAALALYGQPFGFGWDDVDNHRALAAQLRQRAEFGHIFIDMEAEGKRLIAWHDSIAARIAALLPPRRVPIISAELIREGSVSAEEVVRRGFDATIPPV